jgi:4-amino-4-deoxy-L-arabinose transferase-like glycosyltransferase
MKGISSFFQGERNLFWSFLAVYFFLGLAFVFLGKFWTDEGWYFGGSWLVAEGQVPYRDFFIHHNPVFFYVYALPQALFGPSLIVGRLTSLVFMMLTFVLAWKLARKLGGRTAALITAGLLVTNLFIIYYYNTFSYRVLEAFLMLVFFTILFGSLKDSVKYPLAALVLSLVVGVRFPIDIVSGLLVLYLAYVAYRNWRQKRVIVLSWSVAVLSLGVIMLPFIIVMGERFFLATVNFNFLTPSFWVEAGIIDTLGILERLYRILLVQFQVFLNFTAVSVILFGLFFYVVSKKAKGMSTLAERIGKNQNLFLIAAFVVICELLWAIPAYASVGLRTFTFPAAAVLAGAGLAIVMDNLKEKSTGRLLYGLIVGLIVLTPLTQFAQGGEAQPTLNWNNTSAKYIGDVADKVVGYTGEDDKILTFTPAFAFQANRELMPGMLMELYNFFPTWETERAVKHNLLNSTMLLDYLSSREASAVVFTEDRFFSGNNMSRVLDDYRTEILKELEENYYLAEKLTYPPEIGRGSVYIYLPRD